MVKHLNMKGLLRFTFATSLLFLMATGCDAIDQLKEAERLADQSLDEVIDTLKELERLDKELNSDNK